jgi:hypothetical protein
MKYTKDDLGRMGDTQAFQALAEASGAWISTMERWNDLMRLAVEYKISLQHVIGSDEDYWIAGSNTYYSFASKNPQRAIACCLILVFQEQQQ